MTATAPPTTFPCPRCGNILAYGQIVCPRCGGLVYAQRLNQIAAEAQALEALEPVRAAMLWREALPLLPPDSEQRQMVAQRIGALTAGWQPGQDGAAAPQPSVRPPDPWGKALTKTIGSMLLSIVLYAFMFSRHGGLGFGLQFATGFCILILIHELGHVLAMRYFGLSASPPIFIPFLGAVINLRQPPRNALEEAIVGIGGPVLGTVGAAITYLLYLQTGLPLLLLLAEFGFFLNLINMLPVPPLDGGRVTAAVSPWLWMPGLLLVAAKVAYDFFVDGHFSFILVLLLMIAWPRVKATLVGKLHHGPYYQIGAAAKWGMGVAYVLLGLMLAVMWLVTRYETSRVLGPGWF